MDEATLHGLLKRGAKYAASDALFKVGQPPAFRVQGSLHYLKGDPLTAAQTRDLAQLILAESSFSGEIDELTEFDTAYEVEGIGRYRVNVFRQRGSLAIALRNIPLDVPRFDDLGCTRVARELAELDRGLVLVVGAAGNGKSSTLAAMIGHINRRRRVHVITVEDPIEFLHDDNLATISQREIGLDTPSFAVALRAALRQDPDVILVGEIRDEETMDIALKASETGHLVLSTLHTPDVSRTVGRVLALCGDSDAQETRERFADNLKGILAQRLLPAKDGESRVLAQEVFVMTGTAREAIRNPSGSMSIKDVMERGAHPYGMRTFQMHVRMLLEDGKLDAEVARQALEG